MFLQIFQNISLQVAFEQGASSSDMSLRLKKTASPLPQLLSLPMETVILIVKIDAKLGKLVFHVGPVVKSLWLGM